MGEGFDVYGGHSEEAIRKRASQVEGNYARSATTLERALSADVLALLDASTTGDCEAVATPKTFKVTRIWLEGEDRFVSVEVDGQIIHLREGDSL